MELVNEIRQKKEEQEMREIAVTALVSGLGVAGFIAGSLGLGIVSIPAGVGMIVAGVLLKRKSV